MRVYWRVFLRRPLRTTPSPYTTLFRSREAPLPERLRVVRVPGDDRIESREPPVGVGHGGQPFERKGPRGPPRDRKSTRLNSSHLVISYAVFSLTKKIKY